MPTSARDGVGTVPYIYAPTSNPIVGGNLCALPSRSTLGIAATPKKGEGTKALPATYRIYNTCSIPIFSGFIPRDS